MASDPDELTANLLRILGQVENTAEGLVLRGQGIVRTAEESRAVAHDLQNVIHELPSGHVPAGELQHLTSVFGAQQRQQESLMSAIDSRTLSATTTTSTLTASTLVLGTWSTVAALPSVAGTAPGSLGPTPAQQQLLQTIRRYSATNEMLRRLQTLRVKSHASVRYPVDLLQEAGRALTVPSGPQPTITGVLIPAREGITGLVMALLDRLPRRAQGKNWREKVVAIGVQVGLPGLDSTHFENLGQNLEQLVQSLSQGKQKDLSRDIIDQRFDAALRFVLALLDSVDQSKVRSDT